MPTHCNRAHKQTCTHARAPTPVPDMPRRAQLKGGWMAGAGLAPAALGPLDPQHALGTLPACSVDLVVTTRQAGQDAGASQALAASREPFRGVKVRGEVGSKGEGGGGSA